MADGRGYAGVTDYKCSSSNVDTGSYVPVVHEGVHSLLRKTNIETGNYSMLVK